MKYSEIKELKNKLRKSQTPSELILWRYLRRRQLKGRKFIRQHAIIYDSFDNNFLFYIPDFYCEAEKLAVELDGKIHLRTKERDEKRDGILESMGIKVLRIKNEELVDIDAVIDKIMNNLKLDDEDSRFRRMKRK